MCTSVSQGSIQEAVSGLEEEHRWVGACCLLSTCLGVGGDDGHPVTPEPTLGDPLRRLKVTRQPASLLPDTPV
jgi:hypothetical protein